MLRERLPARKGQSKSKIKSESKILPAAVATREQDAGATLSCRRFSLSKSKMPALGIRADAVERPQALHSLGRGDAEQPQRVAQDLPQPDHERQPRLRQKNSTRCYRTKPSPTKTVRPKTTPIPQRMGITMPTSTNHP